MLAACGATLACGGDARGGRLLHTLECIHIVLLLVLDRQCEWGFLAGIEKVGVGASCEHKLDDCGGAMLRRKGERGISRSVDHLQILTDRQAFQQQLHDALTISIPVCCMVQRGAVIRVDANRVRSMPQEESSHLGMPCKQREGSHTRLTYPWTRARPLEL